MKYLLILLLALTGCSSTKAITNPSSSIIIDKRGDKEVVTFLSKDKSEMTYKRGDLEATYNNQTQSLMSRILSAVTLGVVGTRK